jgi:hypothetical protein
MWLTIIAAIIIWIHYSNHFNEKYVKPEPEWFFNTLPFRFYQIWISKFLTEFLFILMLLILHGIFISLLQVDLYSVFNLTGLLLLYSLIILMAIVNFQMMFYYDPRLAGYAYHFTVIFFVVMSINFRLVGPLVTIFMMFYYLYKNYRYFTS